MSSACVNAFGSLVSYRSSSTLLMLGGHKSRLDLCNTSSNNMKPLKIVPMHNNNTGPLRATVLSYSTETSTQNEPRQTLEYHPTIWDENLIESIHSPYADGVFNTRIEELRVEVKHLFGQSYDLAADLELVDKIQRLGLAYHFSEEIDNVLAKVYTEGIESLRGLNDNALCFRLLRQNGYNVSSDVFNKFRDEKGFMKCLADDAKGLLSLYEAAHLAIPEENILDEAKEFSTEHLRKLLIKDKNSSIVELIKQSLEAPLHCLMPRIAARNYIDFYEKEETKSSCLLELAKLDFNVVQALHQKEVKELSRWWEDLGLAKKTTFFRDRLFESYFWASQIAPEPKFSKFRIINTKFALIATVVDDFYDLYGSIEEARIFTSAIRSWDVKAMETLPDDLKMCYLSWLNFANETMYDILKTYGWEAAQIFKPEWVCLCESHLKQAEWLHEGYTPSLEEYLHNDLVFGGLTIPVHAYYFVEENLTEETLDWRKKAYQISYLSALIVRLTDDLAPSEVMRLIVKCFQTNCRK
ncbi:uncharacterized protein A4U43_C06F2470 [Asparagus officinalis]|uniref:Terpene synthase N-terminal domain-containing protein n=1 Tax=Asparagus officinalis TaxID=4686 RepID=A0A5P1EJ17_ASPOF|nr:uncharacterized protein A4U43_C06F2470 [Asparagus officinalis]